MERPTKTIKLPVSGMQVVIYEYYLRGERKAIEAIMLKGFQLDTEKGDPKLRHVDTTYRTQMEDQAVLLAIKCLVDSDGKEIKPTIEILDNLPDEDFVVIQKALPEGQSKKKLTTKPSKTT